MTKLKKEEYKGWIIFPFKDSVNKEVFIASITKKGNPSKNIRVPEKYFKTKPKAVEFAKKLINKK